MTEAERVRRLILSLLEHRRDRARANAKCLREQGDNAAAELWRVEETALRMACAEVSRMALAPPEGGGSAV